MSWSSRNDLAVALGPDVFNRNCLTKKRHQIPLGYTIGEEAEFRGDVTTLSWDPSGHYLAMGTEYGYIQVYMPYIPHIYKT